MRNKNYSISQNFTTSRDLLLFLEQKIQPVTSIVLDVGAGKGAITAILEPKFSNVIAIEADSSLAGHLKRTFPNISVFAQPFSKALLPTQKFSVVANIPFRYTSEIMHALLESKYFTYGLLIMQKEAAEKFAGLQIGPKQTFVGAQASVDFMFSIARHCKRTDFSPVPKVDIVVLEIKRRNKPFLDETKQKQFSDFLAYSFNKSVPTIERAFPKNISKEFANRVISTLTVEELVQLFSKTDIVASIYKNHSMKISSEQQNIKKVFRTRSAQHWYRSD